MTAGTGQLRKRPIDRADMTTERSERSRLRPAVPRPSQPVAAVRHRRRVERHMVRVALTDPLAVNDNGLLMALAAVTVSAWYGGVGPGLLVTLLTLLSVDYVMPLLQPAQSVPMDGLRPSLFASVGILVSALSEAKRHAEDGLERSLQTLERRVQERTEELTAANHRAERADVRAEESRGGVPGAVRERRRHGVHVGPERHVHLGQQSGRTADRPLASRARHAPARGCGGPTGTVARGRCDDRAAARRARAADDARDPRAARRQDQGGGRACG